MFYGKQRAKNDRKRKYGADCFHDKPGQKQG